MVKERHLALVVPGLGDQVILHQIMTAGWRSGGIIPIIHRVGWYDGENFEDKLKKLLTRIDSLRNEADRLSLVGTSAGASAVLNAFCERKNRVHRVVNVCGRLRPGTNVGFRGFDERTKSSKPFRESVIRFSEIEDHLSEEDKKRVLCIYPLLGDELVPRDTCVLKGTNNVSVPIGEHILSIGCAMIFGYVTRFLDKS